MIFFFFFFEGVCPCLVISQLHASRKRTTGCLRGIYKTKIHCFATSGKIQDSIYLSLNSWWRCWTAGYHVIRHFLWPTTFCRGAALHTYGFGCVGTITKIPASVPACQVTSSAFRYSREARLKVSIWKVDMIICETGEENQLVVWSGLDKWDKWDFLLLASNSFVVSHARKRRGGKNTCVFTHSCATKASGIMNIPSGSLFLKCTLASKAREPPVAPELA